MHNARFCFRCCCCGGSCFLQGIKIRRQLVPIASGNGNQWTVHPTQG